MRGSTFLTPLSQSRGSRLIKERKRRLLDDRSSMSDYGFPVVAPVSHREPLAYSIAPRTIPTLVSRFTHPRPPEQNGTLPVLATAQAGQL